jgi:uncharacterized protein (DUF2252 family)
VAGARTNVFEVRRYVKIDSKLHPASSCFVICDHTMVRLHGSIHPPARRTKALARTARGIDSLTGTRTELAPDSAGSLFRHAGYGSSARCRPSTAQMRGARSVSLKRKMKAKTRTQKNGLTTPTVQERMAMGKALRDRVPRSEHAKWKPGPHRTDPITLLHKSDVGRVESLLPIRYGRMRQSPFAFYRGAAMIMAADLSTTPATKLRVQACGDCHLLNFGGFASPERRLVFDINDFDETLPAPWEWDVKRLAASVVLAGRFIGAKEGMCGDAARAAVAAYRIRIREFAEMRALESWYSRLDAEVFIKEATKQEDKAYWRELERAAMRQISEYIFPKITKDVNGRRRITDRPPLVVHPKGIKTIDKNVRLMFARYRLTLPEERRVILDRYQIVDIARKIVGVGSVGTRCDVALLMAGEDDPLFLQFKEARTSVLAEYAGASRYKNQGERVVTGQRMLQSASDVFLGWTNDDAGRFYYFRQLRDMKMKFDLEAMTKSEWLEYVEICGWTLARAHARTGDAAKIGGYLGKNEAFDDAVGKFAVAYADQAEKDHGALVKAIKSGRVKAAKDATE